MLRRRTAGSLLLLLIGISVLAGLWFWRWSPDAYQNRAFLSWQADDIPSAVEILREGITFHGWFPLSKRADVASLQLSLLQAYTRAEDAGSIIRYIETVENMLISEYDRTTIANAYSVVARSHFNSRRWRESYEAFMQEARSWELSPKVFLGAASRAVINAIEAARNGMMVKEARYAATRFVQIVVRDPRDLDDQDLVDIVDRHPEIRPENYNKILEKIAARKAKAIR